MPAEVFFARERSVTTIPINQVLRDGRIDILRSVQRKGYFDIRFSGEHLHVTAGKFVGLIPLNERVYLRVEPKMPALNLLRVLTADGGAMTEVTGADRDYAGTPTQQPEVLTALTNAFVKELRLIEVAGLRKRYRAEVELGSRLRGQIQFEKSVRQAWSRGAYHRATYSFHGQTANLRANQLLRSAALYLLSHHRISRSLPKLATELSHFDELFFRARVDATEGRSVDEDNRGLDPAYAKAVRLASLILSKRGVDLARNGDDVRLPSFVVDLETAFEHYVRRLSMRFLPDWGVLDGNREGEKPLFDDRPGPPANPDIVIRRSNGDYRSILEVKYKTNETREDINQVLAYAVAYRVRRALIVLPAETKGEMGLSAIGSIAGIELHRYRIDLSEALEDAEAQFGEMLNQFLATV